jgi:exodeoxyribonuclease VII large subunit
LAIENQTPKVYAVSELTEEIKTLLEERFEFVWVEGEITNFSSPVSGHYYMVLKDHKAQIRGVMFRAQARYLKFVPENGMKIIAQGRIAVYPPRGEYQIIIDYLEPMGVGALALAFEQLKRKLADQGLFDKDIKKPLPFLPQRIAVITSPTGAAIRDFLKVIFRRFANMEIIVVPVRVQGEGAAADMVAALDLVNAQLKVDVIVLTRGGGSLEDLWAFNQEELAVAIRRSKLPVVSAVGHEIDLTISDLAADFRAPTPSAAAEMLVAEKETLKNHLLETRKHLIAATRTLLKNNITALSALRGGIRDPRKALTDAWIHLDDVHGRLMRLIRLLLRNQRSRLQNEIRALSRISPAHQVVALGRQLDSQRQALISGMQRRMRENRVWLFSLRDRVSDLSPLSILKRGYSITRKLPENVVLKRATGLKAGDRIHVLLFEGELISTIEKVDPD